MKQSEKLDLILKTLHEREDKSGSIVPLLQAKGVLVTLDEAHRLGEKLKKDGYVDYTPTKDSAYVDLNGDGIEYVEEDSYTNKGHSIITNTYNNTIVNSPNANLVNKSTQVSIVQNISGIKQVIEQIREEIDKQSSMSPEVRQDLTDCLQEVENGINVERAPKFAFKALTELASQFASVGSLVIQLGQLTGLISSTS